LPRVAPRNSCSISRRRDIFSPIGDTLSMTREIALPRLRSTEIKIYARLGSRSRSVRVHVMPSATRSTLNEDRIGSRRRAALFRVLSPIIVIAISRPQDRSVPLWRRRVGLRDDLCAMRVFTFAFLYAILKPINPRTIVNADNVGAKPA